MSSNQSRVESADIERYAAHIAHGDMGHRTPYTPYTPYTPHTPYHHVHSVLRTLRATCHVLQAAHLVDKDVGDAGELGVLLEAPGLSVVCVGSST